MGHPVIALDVDGVLIDPTRAGAGNWLDTVGPRHGITREHMVPFFQKDRFGQAVLGRVDVIDVLADYFATIGAEVDAAAFLEDWLAEDLVVNEEVASAAEEWNRAGATIVLATTQEHRRAARLATLFGARLNLVEVVYSARLGVEKPDSEYFEAADALLGRAPVMFVDDALRNVEGARAHGWQAVHYPHEADWRGQVEDWLRVAL